VGPHRTRLDASLGTGSIVEPMSDEARDLAEQFLGPDWKVALDECRDDPELAALTAREVGKVLFDWLRQAVQVDGESGWPQIKDRLFALDKVPRADSHADLVFQAALKPRLMPERLDDETLYWMIRKMPARTSNLMREEAARSGGGQPETELLQRSIAHYRGQIAAKPIPTGVEGWRFTRIVHVGDVVTDHGGIGIGSPWSTSAAPPDLHMASLPGRFPVRLAQAEHISGESENAAAELMISRPTPVRWDLLPRGIEHLGGYTSEAGIGSFGAAEAFTVIDDELPPELFEDPHPGVLVIDREELGTVVAFTVGPQDHDCRTWVGFDDAGNPTRLVTDLGLLDVDPGRGELPWSL
jgi:hypothetical protein